MMDVLRRLFFRRQERLNEGTSVPRVHNANQTEFWVEPPSCIRQSSQHDTAKPSSIEADTQTCTKAVDSEDMGAVREAPKDDTIKNMRVERELLRNEVISLRNDLQEAQDFVFGRLPKQQSLTETEAISSYNALCGMVEDWVESTLGNAMEDMSATKEVLDIATAKILLSIVSRSGKRAFRLQNTDTYNVSSAIMTFLQKYVFDQVLCGTMKDADNELLLSIGDAMRNQTPAKDVAAFRTWHSDTYTAFTEKPGFLQRRKEMVDILAWQLAAALHLLSPGTDGNVFLRVIRDTIVEPAALLAQKMFLSVDLFTLEWTPRYDRGSPGNTAMQPIEFGEVDFSDFAKNGKLVNTISQRDKMDYLFDISPALVMTAARGIEWGERKVLKKAKVLGRYIENGALAKNEQQVPLPSLEGETMLGWLDRQCYLRSSPAEYI
ncbi:hypothetical protein VTL71DRAFT_9564 [Oculimacula yallundae]|uniref:Uncharacterized protein n=1 Tax=Oculimacula yallundae TaxID=86028 RepID=A0ABR4BSZ5_9HELO